VYIDLVLRFYCGDFNSETAYRCKPNELGEVTVSILGKYLGTPLTEVGDLKVLVNI
jgi:hypothetical protein